MEPHLAALPHAPPSPPPRDLEGYHLSDGTAVEDDPGGDQKPTGAHDLALERQLLDGEDPRDNRHSVSDENVTTMKFREIMRGDQAGIFRSNTEHFEWQGSTGTVVAYPLASVRQADWICGTLVLLIKAEDGQHAIQLDDFADIDHDTIYEHFKKYGGVHVRRHRSLAESAQTSLTTSSHSEVFGPSSPERYDNRAEQKKGSPTFPGSPLTSKTAWLDAKPP